MRAAEERRSAPRVEFPEQELERVDGRWTLRFGRGCESEDHNAAMSLATNLAVADALLAAGTGLFRVMAEPDDRSVRRLRHTASAFGLDWPADQSLADFQRSLRTDDPRSSAFLIAVRRAGGGASYEPYRDRRDAVALGDGGRPTPTPRRRCGGSPIATWSRRRCRRRR